MTAMWPGHSPLVTGVDGRRLLPVWAEALGTIYCRTASMLMREAKIDADFPLWSRLRLLDRPSAEIQSDKVRDQ